jgi:ribonucleoside-diphosphate reductase alpha chain
LALVKYKKLVGGGLIKIVNNVVPAALLKLGYAPEQAADIVNYIDQHGTIEGAPGLNLEHLAVFDCSLKPANGKRSIHYMGHARMMAAVQPFLSGAISKTVNMPEEATPDDIANVYVEGWRLGLKSIAIYRDGSKRVQPLNISKERDSGFRPAPASPSPEGGFGLPAASLQEAGPQGEGLRAAGRSRESGAEPTPKPKKRPARKMVLPGGKEQPGGIQDSGGGGQGSEKAEASAPGSQPPASGAEPAAPVPKPYRRKLPDERRAVTHKFSVGAHEGYLTVGLYEDGQPGEIFITMAKEGSTVSGLMDSFATAVSLALQYGVPLKVLCDKFSHMRFEPSGWTNNPEIRYAKSIMDYIFRWLAYKFLPKEARPQEDASVASLNGTETEKAAELASQFTHATAGGPQVAFDFVPSQSGLAGVAQSDDAPSCADCGAIMVRNGSCYRCMNCGATSGCS